MKNEKSTMEKIEDLKKLSDASGVMDRIRDMSETGKKLQNNPAPKDNPKKSPYLDTQLFPECSGTDKDRDIVTKTIRNRNK